jgi:hypothetical protein
MVLEHAVSTVLVLLALGRPAAALSDVPLPGNFVRRSVAKATVLGDYVYVDGGEISQLGDDGKIGQRASNQGQSYVYLPLLPLEAHDGNNGLADTLDHCSELNSFH